MISVGRTQGDDVFPKLPVKRFHNPLCSNASFIKVIIRDESNGPWFYDHLLQGKYEIIAVYKGDRIARYVAIDDFLKTVGLLINEKIGELFGFSYSTVSHIAKSVQGGIWTSFSTPNTVHLTNTFARSRFH